MTIPTSDLRKIVSIESPFRDKPPVVLPILNLLLPPTCKSINSEPAAEAVSVTLSLMPVNVVETLFHVVVRFEIGTFAMMVPYAKYVSVITESPSSVTIWSPASVVMKSKVSTGSTTPVLVATNVSVLDNSPAVTALPTMIML